jgi:hypothetical protein
MPSSIGHWTLPVPSQVMRLRRAVPKIPAKSSYLAALPFYKSRPLRTHLESTLAQVLIPRHFISFKSNTYKKQGGGTPSFSLKVWQLVTGTLPSATHSQQRPQRFSIHRLASRFSGYPGGGGTCQGPAEPSSRCLSILCFTAPPCSGKDSGSPPP